MHQYLLFPFRSLQIEKRLDGIWFHRVRVVDDRRQCMVDEAKDGARLVVIQLAAEPGFTVPNFR